MFSIEESSFIYDPIRAKQKEINHDILWREGKTPRGDVTFTPRLIAVDLKGSLNTLKQEGHLYETNQQEEVKWSGDVTLHKSSPASKNTYLSELENEEPDCQHQEDNKDTIEDVDMKDSLEVKGHYLRLVDNYYAETAATSSQIVFGKRYYNLDDDVKVWSDYLRVYLHPKTLKIVEQYTHLNTLQPFDIYGCGYITMEDYGSRIDLEDRIHYFTEECDHLQGFHVLLDTFDGFGGIGAHTLQHLQDEFSSKSMMTFGFTPLSLADDTAQNRANRILNSALSFHKCFCQSSLFFPLSLAQSLWKTIGPPVNFPYLDYKIIDYHTSAILATVLDTASSPYRTVNPIHMRDITDNLNSHGKTVVSVSTSTPLGMGRDSSYTQFLQDLEGELPWKSITPHCKNNSIPFMQSVVVRGIPQTSSSPRGLFSSCRSVEDTLQTYLTEKFNFCLNAGTVINEPCHVSSPFPHIFSKEIDRLGFSTGVERSPYEGVESIPMMTSVQSSPDTGNVLKILYTEAKKLNIRKHTRFLEAGLEEDDFREVLNDIATLEKCYTFKSDMGT